MDPIVERWYARQIPGERCWTVRRVAYHPSHQEVIIPSTTERVARHVVALQNAFYQRVISMFTEAHNDAAHEALKDNPGVQEAWRQYRAAGGSFLDFFLLLAKYGPAIVEIIQQIIGNLPKPPVPPPAK